MTFLPIVDRELRVASRRPWTYWGRSCSGLLVVVVIGWLILVERSTDSVAMARSLFEVTSFLCLLFALLAGVLFSADSISVERREGTLGLLFLTDLRGYDVALGKLVSSSVHGFFCLFSAIPVLALPLLMGGVAPMEYWRMVLGLVLVFLTSISVGLWTSTLAREGRGAGVLAACVLLSLSLGGPLLFWLLNWSLSSTGPDDDVGLWLAVTSPFFLFVGSFEDNYKDLPWGYWVGCLVMILVAVGSLGVACHRLPTLWHDAVQGSQAVTWKGRFDQWLWPTRAARTRHRTRLLDKGPMVWLLERHWTRDWAIWMFLLGVGVVYLLLTWAFKDDWNEAPGFLVTSILLHTVFKFWIAYEAPRQFVDDRQSGSMELLLTTSMNGHEIVQGRMEALRRLFMKPLFVVLAADCLFFFVAETGGTGVGDWTWQVFGVCRMALLALDCYAMAWTGLWRGMKTVSGRTFFGVIFRILGVPWILTFGLLALALLSGSLAGVLDGMEASEALILWAMLGGGSATYFILRSRAELLERFRELASQQVGKSKPKPEPKEPKPEPASNQTTIQPL